MSDILCDWLNNELDLSQKVDQNSFAKDFSNGYLIGEVLNKYQLQHDFDQFSQSYSADSKLNNFTRIEPTLNLLMIPFDTNLAREIMTQTHGVVTRLMYQLFIALNNKKKSNLTGIAMETMRAAAPVKLEAVESIMYQDRLKQKTPRQTDLNLDALVAKFHEKQVTLETNAFKQRFLEQERLRDKHQSERQALIERAKYLKQKQKDLLAKIDAATVDIPKTPPHRGRQALLRQKQLHTKKVTEETMRSIWEFEEKMKSVIEPSKPLGPEDFHREVTETELTAAAAAAGAASPTKSQKSELDLIKPASNDEYIGKIRKRLQEDSAAREEREKRRRKVLVDQLKAHEYQEEARREEMLVNRLMRQSQQERRIAVQLLQARHEKEAIRNNRIYREQQYEQRRARDFNDALDKEAQMAKIAKLEYEEQTKKDKILHDKISEDRQIAKYNKHYNQCRQVLNQIVDLTCKTVEYRQLTDNLIPEKLWRDWTTLFLEGKSLYENEAEIKGLEDFTPQEILEEERQQLLDETDFKEYKEMVGEWSAPESSEISGPPRDNPIVGYVVKRLYEMVHPASPPAAAPQFPEFPIKACILGKAFSGKTSCIRALMNNKRVQLLNADDLVVMAINAHRNDEVEEIPVPEFEEENLPVTAGSTTPGATTTPAPTSPGANTPAPGVNAPTAAVELTDAPVEDVAAAAPTDSNKITEEQSEIGAEKSDPEKPVVEDESQSELSSSYLSKSESPVKTQPTERAKLGLKASKCLKKGKPVDDEIVVDILVEAIRRIPEGTGWILDGYPTTYSQAKLVEKALSGFDTGVSNEILTGAGVGGRRVSRIGKKSIIAPDPRPAPPIPDPVSGLNVVILLNVEDEICLKRSAGRMYATQSEEVYQQEFKPPPEGSMTGINKQEKVKPVSDEAHDQEQLQHRMTSFADNWPKLEKWFNKFGTLRIVEGTLNEEAVYLETEKILEDTLAQLEGGKTEEESNPVEQSEITIEEQKPVETVEKPVEIAEVPSAAAADQPQTSRPASKKSRTGSRSGSAKGSPSRNKSPNKSKSRESSGKRSGGSGKEKSSPKGSAKRGRSGKKSKTPEPIEPIEPLEPLEPAGPPPPQPGSQQWTFVDLPIEPELASVLATNWDAIETTYLSNSKVVFRNVREERENVIRYFYQIKKDFMEYLRRPDSKQEFVKQWQDEYNSVADDTRNDDETRCELHECVDDLRERLWSICDERKQQAEDERTTTINDGWLDDRLGILSNHYITLIQAELDRFQDTTRLLKDYYRGMDGLIPDELKDEYSRIPLIELPVIERADSPAKSVTTETAADVDEMGSRGKSITPSAGAPPAANKRKSKETPEPQTDTAAIEESKPRIPLVPRRPVSPDPNAPAAQGKASKDKEKKKKQGDELETPPPPGDADEKLMFDAYWTAIQAIHSMMSIEQAAREAEEEAEKLRELEKQKDAEKASAAKKGGKDGGKGGKGGKKSRSPSPKKGKKEAAAAAAAAAAAEPVSSTTPVEEESEEEKAKKELKERKTQEYYFCLNEECDSCKVRLELIKCRGFSVLQDLKSKADLTFKSMNDWLGARFLKEMESIDYLSEVMRHHIESGERIDFELRLDQQDFMFNTDLKVIETPSPEPPATPIEQPMMEIFTVDQLVLLYKQFSLVAPEGVLSTKAFIDMIQDMTTLTHGMETLPDVWLNITPNQLQDIAAMISPDSEYIDWRAFLLTISQPLSRPTQTQLLQSLNCYKQMDQKNTGFVTREQFETVEFWFSQDIEVQPGEYDRLAHLKRALFDFFADHSSEPSKLDYVDMLMYFAVAPDSHEGFLRALTVAVGSHIPRLAKKQQTTAGDITDEDEMNPAAAAVSMAPASLIDEEIPASDAKVPMESLLRVFHHGERHRGDSHRFAVTSDPEDTMSKERIAGVYQELDSESCKPVLYSTLIEHPVIQDILSRFHRFKAPEIKQIISSQVVDNTDSQSMKTID